MLVDGWELYRQLTGAPSNHLAPSCKLSGTVFPTEGRPNAIRERVAANRVRAKAEAILCKPTATILF